MKMTMRLGTTGGTGTIKGVLVSLCGSVWGVGDEQCRGGLYRTCTGFLYMVPTPLPNDG